MNTPVRLGGDLRGDISLQAFTVSKPQIPKSTLTVLLALFATTTFVFRSPSRRTCA
jgi:hypothetical protein